MDKVKKFLLNNTLVSNIIFFATIIITLFIWLQFFPDKFFIFAVIIIVETLLYSMFYMEKKNTSAKEIALMASLATLSVVGRVAFFALPQIKPTAAVVFISGLCLGKGPGFLIGLLSMFLSNFFFGHSFHTPFQMLGMALVGFFAGCFSLLNLKHKLKLWQEVSLSFVFTFLIYGLIVDASSILFLYTYQGELAIYTTLAQGVPFNLAHGLSTAIFLFFLSPLLSRQLSRVCRKYGLFMFKDYASKDLLK